MLAQFKLEPLASKESFCTAPLGWYMENCIKILIVTGWSSEKAKAELWLESNAKQLSSDHSFCILRILLIVVAILHSYLLYVFRLQLLGELAKKLC